MRINPSSGRPAVSKAARILMTATSKRAVQEKQTPFLQNYGRKSKGYEKICTKLQRLKIGYFRYRLLNEQFIIEKNRSFVQKMNFNSRSRASSVNGETDGNLTDPHEQKHFSPPPRRSQSPRRSQTHSIPRSQGVPLMPQVGLSKVEMVNIFS